MKKSIKILSVLSMAGVMVLGLCGCGGGKNENTTPNPTDQIQTKPVEPTPTDDNKEIITELKAKLDLIKVSVGDTRLLTTFYIIKGSHSLNAAEKLCSYESSDEAVVKIVNKTFKAVAPGTATIKVTSKKDNTKSCILNVEVKDVYFDRDRSMISTSDNMSSELPEDGGYIETVGDALNFYMIKGYSKPKAYVEATMTLKSVNNGELYPKVGIVFDTVGNTSPQMNKLCFFLNAEIGEEGISSFNGFGICEVNSDGNWAWNPGVTDMMARHKDFLYRLPEGENISLGDSFKLGVIRDGFDFHFFVNDIYTGSMKTLEDLFGVAESDKYVPADALMGFFHFNSQVKYEKYMASCEESVVNDKISLIKEVKYVTEWDVDEN